MSPREGASAPGNRLLAAIPRADRTAILAMCDSAHLTFGATLAEPEATIRHVYFPVSSYISLITPKDASASLEVGLVGNEGMLGITLALGIATSPLKGLVQGEGAALRMSAADFRQALQESAGFSRALNAYLYVLMGQIAQSAACGRFHRLEARLARWILMTHDRAGANTFRITHEFLAHMLGVRRPGVSEAAGLLQKRQFIHYRHGIMQVLDRQGLERTTCACYGTVNRLYSKHLGPKVRVARGVPHTLLQ